MDDRQREILRATIHHYIQTAEPVGSQTLREITSLSCSPATIRSELNQLEKQGYLQHVHTSSGRVPTDQGYRLYVDTLMESRTPPADWVASIESDVMAINQNVGVVLSKMTQVVSALLNYTAIVMTPEVLKESLKVIHLILVDLDKILVVLLNSVGMNREVLLRISETYSQDELNTISKILTRKLEGRSVFSLTRQDFSDVVSQLPQADAILDVLYTELKKVVQASETQHLLSSGVSKMVKLPEFQDIAYARNVLELLEESKTLCNFLSDCTTQDHCQVVIGSESPLEGLQNCSLVVSPIKHDQTPIGVVGVLGPKRMTYATVVPLVQKISEMITNSLPNSYESKEDQHAHR